MIECLHDLIEMYPGRKVFKLGVEDYIRVYEAYFGNRYPTWGGTGGDFTAEIKEIIYTVKCIRETHGQWLIRRMREKCK